MRIIPAIIFSLFISMSSPASAAGTADTHPNCLVEVMVTYQDPDPVIPWQRGHVADRRGYGIAIPDGRILTLESIVKNAKLVEIRKARSGDKILAKVDLADESTGLALLAPADPRKTSDLKPVELAEKAELKDKVAIIQFDETDKMQEGEGDIILTSAGTESYIPVYVINYQVQTDLGINGDGCPVFINGKLLGIVSGHNQKTVNIIGFPSIRRFIDDFNKPPYEGLPVAGFRGKLLLDQSARKYLGVPEGKGLMVIGTPPFSPARDKLKLNDIILSIDGHEIDNLGFYNDPALGRLRFPYIISGYRKAGDTSEFRVLRDHKELTISIPMTKYDDSLNYIPEEAGPEDSEFLLNGGLMFRELSGRYLRAMGQRAMMPNGLKLNYLYSSARNDPPEPQSRIVFIQTVLPDDINVGYQNIYDNIVTAVNGKPVKSMKDVFAAYDSDGAIHTVTLDGIGVDLVLDRATIKQADARIAAQFNIPKLQNRKK